MMKNCKLVLFLLVTSAFFNQLIAQKPDDFRVSESGSVTDDLRAPLAFVENNHSFMLQKTSGAGGLRAAQAERELLDSIVYLETYEGMIFGGNKQAWEYLPNGHAEHFNWYFWDTNAATWSSIQQLDSIFDAAGRLSVLIKNGWDNNAKQWKPENKTEFSYNADGLLILYADYLWNAETKAWVNKSKSESTHSYTTDGSHFIVSVTYTYDNAKGEWVIHHRNEINYDAKGNQTLYNASFFDSGSNAWIFKKGSFKYENTYNEQGKITLSSYYTWSSEKNQWEGQGDLIETGYDSNGNATQVIIKNLDSSSNQWVNISKTDNSYCEHGNLTGVISSEWDNKNSLWVVASKKELLYDAHENLLKSQVLLLDTVSKEWYINEKDEYTYDVNNRETLKEQYKRNGKGQLALKGKQETAYDTFGNIALSTSYDLDTLSGNFIKKNDTKYTYNASGEKLTEVAVSSYEWGSPYITKSNFYYSLHTVSSIGAAKEMLSSFVYPGLFTDKLSFQLDNTNDQYVFDLFNTQGQKVLSKQVKHSETIYVANLPGGVYLYTLSLDNKVIKGKLVKK